MKRKFEIISMVTLVLFSYGFDVQWPWMEKKDPAPKKKTETTNQAKPNSVKTEEPKPAVQQSEPNQPSPKTQEKKEAEINEAVNSLTRKFKVKPMQSEGARNNQVEDQEASPQENQIPENPDTEIQKIQTNLLAITEQTRAIQTQGQADRQRLQTIMQQVEIQKKLIQTVQVPKPVLLPVTPVNTEEIIRNTKIHLIADEVKQTQETLKNLPHAQPIQQVIKSPAQIQPIPIVKKNTT